MNSTSPLWAASPPMEVTLGCTRRLAKSEPMSEAGSELASSITTRFPLQAPASVPAPTFLKDGL